MAGFMPSSRAAARISSSLASMTSAQSRDDLDGLAVIGKQLMDEGQLLNGRQAVLRIEGVGLFIGVHVYQQLGKLPGLATGAPPVICLDAAHDPCQECHDGHPFRLRTGPVQHPGDGFLEQIAPVDFRGQTPGMQTRNHFQAQEIHPGEELEGERPGGRCFLEKDIRGSWLVHGGSRFPHSTYALFCGVRGQVSEK